jgi:hypothetical protein
MTVGSPSICCDNLFLNGSSLRYALKRHFSHLMSLIAPSLLDSAPPEFPPIAFSTFHCTGIGGSFAPLPDIARVRQKRFSPTESFPISQPFFFELAFPVRPAPARDPDFPRMAKDRPQQTVFACRMEELSPVKRAAAALVRRAADLERMLLIEQCKDTVVCLTPSSIFVVTGQAIKRVRIREIHAVRAARGSVDFEVREGRPFSKVANVRAEVPSEEVGEQLVLLVQSLLLAQGIK